MNSMVDFLGLPVHFDDEDSDFGVEISGIGNYSFYLAVNNVNYSLW